MPGAKPGDSLLFTKALGTGVISTAIKKGKAEPGMDRCGRAIDDYAEQEGGGSDPRREFTDSRHDRRDRIRADRSCARDGAGFGCVDAAFHAGIPLLEGALECVRAGYIPGGLKNNRDFAECLVEYDDGFPTRYGRCCSIRRRRVGC